MLCIYFLNITLVNHSTRPGVLVLLSWLRIRGKQKLRAREATRLSTCSNTVSSETRSACLQDGNIRIGVAFSYNVDSIGIE